jgi:hypothetical protein
MDSTQTSIVAILGLVVSVFGSILAAINHRRVRSNCCGIPLVMSVDVESTTPPLAGSAATMQPLAIKIPESVARRAPSQSDLPKRPALTSEEVLMSDAQKKEQATLNLAVD